MPDNNIMYDYVVYKSGSTYCAIDNTGAITSKSSFNTLMASINRALSSGGSVFIKDGTFDVGGSGIIISNSINIYGAGMGKTILKRRVTTADSTLFFTASNVTVDSLTMDGNARTNPTSGWAEIGSTQTNFTLNRVEVKDFNYIGISAENAKHIISNCVLTGLATSGSSSYGIWSDLSPSETLVLNSKVTGCDLNGVFMGGVARIENCYFANNAGPSGGQIATGDSLAYLLVKGCAIDASFGSNGSGIEASHQSTAGGIYVIIGNRISSQGTSGITSNGGTIAPAQLIIKGNIIRNNGYEGITLYSSGGAMTHFLISDNIIYDDQATPTQAYAIDIQHASSNHFIVQNNICFGNVSGQINDATGGTANKVMTGNITA